MKKLITKIIAYFSIIEQMEDAKIIQIKRIIFEDADINDIQNRVDKCRTMILTTLLEKKEQNENEKDILEKLLN